jgi:hypothetical protein
MRQRAVFVDDPTLDRKTIVEGEAPPDGIDVDARPGTSIGPTWATRRPTTARSCARISTDAILTTIVPTGDVHAEAAQGREESASCTGRIARGCASLRANLDGS